MPLWLFKKNVDRLTIKDVCRITHNNDEAYVGALSIFLAIQFVIENTWDGGGSLIDKIVAEIPDTNVRDRLIELRKLSDCSIVEVGKKFKTSGYVADSVPIAIFAAQKIDRNSFYEIITDLIKIGGDTDTVCSMAGQIIGALKGTDCIPLEWMDKYNELEIAPLVNDLTKRWKE